MEFVYQEIGIEMNFLSRFKGRFRPNMEIHSHLRAMAEETIQAAEAVNEKRRYFEERDFPISGFLQNDPPRNRPRLFERDAPNDRLSE